MVNFQERVLLNPQYCRQFDCGNSLITIFNCPSTARMMTTKYADLWARENYLFYVLEGRKIWHTVHGSYDVKAGSCVFVRKGACILEQFLETGFCVVLFFIPDEFICEVLKTKAAPIIKSEKKINAVISLDTTETLRAFFVSMYSYFAGTKDPDKSLLELKFRELILTIADNPKNTELLSYFCMMLNEPKSMSLQRVMDENFCFNLKLEQYAELSNRSLSAFKRDFQKQFNTTPGKWLMEKRLNHSMHLLTNLGKNVSEAAFESGFESASHFSRSFRQYFGTSPASVKQQVSN